MMFFLKESGRLEGEESLLSGKSGQQLSEWWKWGKLHVENLLQILKKQAIHRPMLGLVINPQYLKLLKIKHDHDQYEVEFFNVMELPDGLMTGFEIKNSEAMGDCLRRMIDASGLADRDVVLSIPRSSAIIKTILVDGRLRTNEIESRVWLEANRLFPNLIGEIYLDFAVNGPAPQDASQLEVLIGACRKEQLKPFLDVLHGANLTATVVDINYYVYERALLRLLKQSPEIKTAGFLNINFGLIDLLVIHEGKLIFMHELNYDARQLMKLHHQEDHQQTGSDSEEERTAILKASFGLHLKHALQFFYSSRPNARLERLILGGDVPAHLTGVLEYVMKETAKEVVLVDPFVGMKFAASVDMSSLRHYAPALMLCCGLALTGLGTEK